MRKVIALAVLAAAAVVMARRQLMHMMADVPPELRSPLLPLMPSSFNPLTLALTRAIFRMSLRPGPGVTLLERRTSGEPAIRALVTTPIHLGRR